MSFALLLSVFVIATCGLVYELIAGALASYLLGDSVTQFSTVIGVYLFSMGIGSYLSKHVQRNLISVFIQVEILVGIVGGFSAAILFLMFEHVSSFRVLLYSLVGLTGTMVGLEIPLLMRILKGKYEFKDLVAKVFTYDYVGALLASLIFPLVLVPHLGLVKSSFLFGTLNVAVAIWALYLFGRDVAWARLLRGSAAVALVALAMGFVYADRIMSFAESSAYPDSVIYAKSSPYQRIVMTKRGDELRLFLNGNLQFSSRDEYRYHEALVHPGMSALGGAKNVLVLGGGDGLAVRELLKYPAIEHITLVDLDAAMTNLFSSHEALVALNERALLSPKVQIVNTDAFLWLQDNQKKFDYIVIDFPDPSNFSVGKLYTTKFFRLLDRSLAPDGALVIQSTSPYVARRSFWCVANTLQSVGFRTAPYHAYVPSFGEWGYILASRGVLPAPTEFLPGLKFLNPEIARTMFHFPPDMAHVDTEVHRLNNQILVRYFEEEWAHYVQ